MKPGHNAVILPLSCWYQHDSGKITALWPGFTFEFWRRTRVFDAADYELGS